MSQEVKHSLLENVITERCLVKFLKEIISEEERLGRSVPGPDCRQMLKTYLRDGNVTDRQLQTLIKKMVEIELLSEDRKDLKVNVVGYFGTSVASMLIQEFGDSVKRDSYPDDLSIPAIKKLQDEQEKQVPKRAAKTGTVVKHAKRAETEERSSGPVSVSLDQMAAIEAGRRIAAIENELSQIRETLAKRRSNLESRLNTKSKTSTSQVLMRIRDQITILSKLESEEEAQLEVAKRELERHVSA